MPVSTLLLRFAAPMQSWGDGSRFSRRDTRREPTKSGVVGFVAAAFGRRRTDAIDDIASLSYGVRIDRNGVLLRDFHTARNESQAFVSERYYLADAIFLVGLSGERTFLEQIDQAIRSPVFPLFLGRRSCPPEGRVTLGLREMILLEALKAEPWLAAASKKPKRLEIVCDGQTGSFSHDHPISFSQTNRTYAFRSNMRTEAVFPEHDSMAML